MTPRLSEFELIAELFAPLATAPGALGLRDDAAVIPSLPGCETVVTADALVEGVHFLADDPPETIARKALRVNLSDLAAKGAIPAGYFLALTLPARIGMDWLSAFARGLKQDGETFAVPLLGGDTTSTPGPLTLAITAVGHVPAGTMTRRAGAMPGDAVFVSGTIGDAGGGLEILLAAGAAKTAGTPENTGPAGGSPNAGSDPLRTAAAAQRPSGRRASSRVLGERTSKASGTASPINAKSAGGSPNDVNEKVSDYLVSRYRVPTPRLALGQALRGIATASLDVSDGLIADLGHIAEVSVVGIRIDASSIPRAPALRALWGDDDGAIARAATAGDDYELAFTARDEAEVWKKAKETGVSVTRIGIVTAGRGVALIGTDGKIPISHPGYRHF